MFLSKRYAYKHWAMRLCIFVFDFMGYAFIWPFRRRPNENSWRNIKKILVIRLDHLGDAVMTRPALRALRKLYPEAQIDLLMSEDLAGLFEDAAEVSKVIPLKNHWFSRTAKLPALKILHSLIPQIKDENYDLGIDFRGDLRHIYLMWKAKVPIRIGYGITGGGFLLSHCAQYPKSLHQVKVNLNLLHASIPEVLITDEPLPAFASSGEDRSLLLSKIQHRLLPGLRRVIIHPGAGYASKRWPTERFKYLCADLLSDDSVQIVIIGSESEKILFENINHPRILDLRGATNLSDLPIIFELCHVYVGNDSGPAHIAASQGIPIVSIFSGTNDYRLWHPYSSKLELITHAVRCSPCEAEICPLGHHDCMTQITETTVLDKIKLFLKDTKPA